VETLPAKTKEVPKEAPAEVSGAKTEGKPFYSVQLGAFKSEGTAEALTKTYKGKGYETYTHKGEVTDKGTLYRVLVGTFKDRKEALHFAAQIESKEKVKTTVFSGGTK
jgi:cell division septation protein DedD